jgi:hypothetical protein
MRPACQRLLYRCLRLSAYPQDHLPAEHRRFGGDGEFPAAVLGFGQPARCDLVATDGATAGRPLPQG